MQLATAGLLCVYVFCHIFFILCTYLCAEYTVWSVNKDYETVV